MSASPIINNKIRFYSKCIFLLGLLFAIAIILFSAKATLEWRDYHNYADQREFFSILHFSNVSSNIFLIAIGLWGLIFTLRNYLKERTFYLIFFLGVLLAGLGATYYHYNPNNARLVLDRIPIAVAFMALYTAIIAERIHFRFAQWLLPILLAFGILSVLYWYYTLFLGQADLRFYMLVQVYPMLSLPIILLIFKSPYTKNYYLWLALVSYLLAKVVEFLDWQIYLATNSIISGHTLKHLFAALACFCILLYIKLRKPAVNEKPFYL